jgi:trigger factor
MSAKDVEEPEVDEQDVAEGAEEPKKLTLDVKIDKPSACERHVTVTVSREDVDRYLDEAYSELMETAAVPGFRVGRAPRKLVENRFKDEIGEKIKGSLLMDSLSQISEDQSFTAISEPDLKLDAIEVPDDGPMVFEFDIEVRPDRTPRARLHRCRRGGASRADARPLRPARAVRRRRG